MLKNNLIRGLLLSATFVAVAAMTPEGAHAADVNCQVEEVAHVIGSRVHVKCVNTTNVVYDGTTYGIRWVAIAHNASYVNHFVALANAALLAGKVMVFNVPTAHTTNTSGCSTSNCRTPVEFRIVD